MKAAKRKIMFKGDKTKERIRTEANIKIIGGQIKIKQVEACVTL